MTPRLLFEWASSSVPAVSFEYCSTDDYKREKTHLERRFERTRTIPGTRELHSFVPISRDRVRTESFHPQVSPKKKEKE